MEGWSFTIKLYPLAETDYTHHDEDVKIDFLNFILKLVLLVSFYDSGEVNWSENPNLIPFSLGLDVSCEIPKSSILNQGKRI